MTLISRKLIAYSKTLKVELLLAACLSTPVLAAETDQAARGEPPHSYNVGGDRVALKGYDPVSYFMQHDAAKGKHEFSAMHQGLTYYFVSAENQKLFAANPEKYLPAYGGWCATAMAKGKKVQVDPSNFKVTNGRLFLFYKGLRGNALNDWNQDEPGLTTKADANWKTLDKE